MHVPDEEQPSQRVDHVGRADVLGEELPHLGHLEVPGLVAKVVHRGTHSR